MPADPDLLVTADAELCTRHRASLQQVWEWRTELAQSHCASHLLPPRKATAFADGGPRSRLRRLKTAAEVLRQRTAQTTASASAAAAPFLRAATAVPTGLRTLDSALLGGLRRGWVTELTGLPGSGKTTLAAAWSRHAIQHAAHSGQRCDGVWLQSGSAVPPAVLSIAFDPEAQRGGDAASRCLADSVHVATLGDLDELQDMLCVWAAEDPEVCALRNVGLIVVDSITDLVRRAFAYRDADALRRHNAVAAVLQTLKRIADVFNVAVLVVTQQQQQQQIPQSRAERAPDASRRQSSRDDNDVDEDGGLNMTRGGHSRSAAAEDVGQLGRLFFHNVNVRLQLRSGAPVVASAMFDADDGDSTAAQRLRWQVEVIKSPLCAPFAVALQLCVPPDASLGFCGTDAPAAAPLPGPPLGVAELCDAGTAVVPLAPPACETEGWLVSCIDQWDHTEVPSFVYV